MAAGRVAVLEVGRQKAQEVDLVQDDDVVQALSAERPNEPLRVRVLPLRPRRRDHLLDPQRLDCTSVALSVGPVSSSTKNRGAMSSGKAWTTCPGRPFSVRIRSHVEMQHAPTVMCQNYEPKQGAECGRRHVEEARRHQGLHVVL